MLPSNKKFIVTLTLTYIKVNHLSVRIVSFDHIVGWPLLAGVSTVPDKVIQWRSVND